MSSRLLYVGGLVETTTTQHLRDLFAPFGKVEWAHIVTHKFTGKMAGYGFVEMDSEDHAIRAATALEGTDTRRDASEDLCHTVCSPKYLNQPAFSSAYQKPSTLTESLPPAHRTDAVPPLSWPQRTWDRQVQRKGMCRFGFPIRVFSGRKKRELGEKLRPAPRPPQTSMPTQTMRIALLHLAPIPADVKRNRRLVERAISKAADAGATWIITPELAVCGYTFADRIGTDWIVSPPDPWITAVCRLAARLRITVFLSHPERDGRSNTLYNTVFVIAPDGAITGKHRKINTLRKGSEAWSSPGNRAAPIPVPPVSRVGILICADACSPGIPGSLRLQALSC